MMLTGLPSKSTYVYLRNTTSRFVSTRHGGPLTCVHSAAGAPASWRQITSQLFSTTNLLRHRFDQRSELLAFHVSTTTMSAPACFSARRRWREAGHPVG